MQIAYDSHRPAGGFPLYGGERSPLVLFGAHSFAPAIHPLKTGADKKCTVDRNNRPISMSVDSPSKMQIDLSWLSSKGDIAATGYLVGRGRGPASTSFVQIALSPRIARPLEGFTRLFAATIFFGTEEQPSRAAVIDWARFHFFDRMRLWFNRDDVLNSSAADQHDNVIILSEAFYREIDEHRIPVERR